MIDVGDDGYVAQRALLGGGHGKGLEKKGRIVARAPRYYLEFFDFSACGPGQGIGLFLWRDGKNLAISGTCRYSARTLQRQTSRCALQDASVPDPFDFSSLL